jgi:hypothetical protein
MDIYGRLLLPSPSPVFVGGGGGRGGEDLKLMRRNTLIIIKKPGKPGFSSSTKNQSIA